METSGGPFYTGEQVPGNCPSLCRKTRRERLSGTMGQTWQQGSAHRGNAAVPARTGGSADVSGSGKEAGPERTLPAYLLRSTLVSFSPQMEKGRAPVSVCGRCHPAGSRLPPRPSEVKKEMCQTVTLDVLNGKAGRSPWRRTAQKSWGIVRPFGRERSVCQNNYPLAFWKLRWDKQ